jgi:TRAP-type C4-dicarboxylate transport system permease small subunit
MVKLKLLALVAIAVAVFAMAGLTFVDVIGRYFFNAPIPGAFEIVGLILGIAMIGAFPLVTFQERHITVDLFDSFIRGRFRRARQVTVRLGTAAMAGFMAERLYAAAIDEWANDFVTENLEITRVPLLLVMAAICAFTAVGMIIITIRGLRQPVKDIEKTTIC